MADEAHTLSHPHPSVVYDRGSFLCKNSLGVLSKMLPCISISELLSQLAINSLGQTQGPPPHPVAEACDGGCAVATMQHSVAIPASLNLSVRDHINSTCHALLIGWDGKYGYPHQYLMREGGGRVWGVKGGVYMCVYDGGCTGGLKSRKGMANNLFPSPTPGLEAWQLSSLTETTGLYISPLSLPHCLSLWKKKKTISNELWK